MNEFLTLKRTAMNVLQSKKLKWIFVVGRDETQMFPVSMCMCIACADVITVNDKCLLYHTEQYEPLCSRCVITSQHKHGIVEPLMGWVNRRVTLSELNASDAATVQITQA